MTWPYLVIVALDTEETGSRIGVTLQRLAIPWIAWNASDDPALALTAYSAHASAVLPSTITPVVFVQCIQTTLATHAAPTTRKAAMGGNRRHMHYRRGDTIRLDDGDVLDVASGVVSQRMIHQDGSEVLLGLNGPGQILLGHPDDTCYLHLHAHTDTAVVIRTWDEATMDATLPERLRTRVRFIEGWAAMQARAYIDQRIIGILSILGEQFGTPHSLGLLVDVRITHAQLASAVGATRSTVTRLLGDLRERDVLATVGAGERERYCLRTWESLHHLHSCGELAARTR